jgi:tetratricopeptide (TPR) repeat protein
MNKPVFVLPKSLEAIKDYAVLGEKMESPEGVIELETLVQTALQEHPDHGLPHAAWGWYLAKQKKLVDAVESLDRAIELGPDTFRPQWYLDRGIYFALQGHGEKALADMTQCSRDWPKDPNAHHLRGLELKRLGDGLSGVLEEQIGLVLAEKMTAKELYQFIHQYVFYAGPDRLEMTLMILCEPLNSSPRAFRAECLMNIGVPSAAFHDYLLANRFDPKNLGYLVRLEEIQQSGLMSSGPLSMPEKPDIKLWPFYQDLLDGYTEFCNSIVIEPEYGIKIGLMEKIIGRASHKNSFSLNQTSWNMVATGLGLSFFSSTLIVILASVMDWISDNKSLQLNLQNKEIGDIIQIICITSIVLLSIAMVVGIISHLYGTIQLIFQCRVADLQTKLSRLHFLVRTPMVYLFVLLCVAVIIIHMLLQAFTINCLARAIQFGMEQIRQSF